MHEKRPKHLIIEHRDRSTPEVANWRKSIFERDNYTCQECGERGKRIEAHHKKNWKDYPNDRFDINNGVTLCKSCHCKTSNYGNRNNAIR